MSQFKDEGKNLAREIKRVDRRANCYGLYNKPAADVARRRRNLKNNKKNLKDRLNLISRELEENRKNLLKNDLSSNESLMKDLVEKNKKLEALENKYSKRLLEILEEIEELCRVIASAPIVRQVKREDSRRSKNEANIRKEEANRIKAESYIIRKKLSDLKDPDEHR